MSRSRIAWVCILAISAALAATRARAADEEAPRTTPAPAIPGLPPGEALPIEATADRIQYVRDEKKIVGEGNVAIAYKGVRLTSDRVEFFTETKKAYAEGHVTIHEAGDLLQADKVYYDFENRQGSFPGGRTVDFPWYGKGEEIEQISKDEIRVANGSITTCDLDAPHYDIMAKHLTIYPGDKMIARNVYLRILGHPVLWLPYLNLPLDNRELPLQVTPGYSSEHGWYVLTSKGIGVNKHITLKPHFDYRRKRGFAAGLDVNYDFDRLGKGFVWMYGMEDDRSPIPGAADPFRERKERKRGRVRVKHRAKIDENTFFRAEWHELSDEFFLQDFFEKEFRKEVQPESYFILSHARRRFGIFAEVAKRSNRFFTTTERLPEIRFNWNTREIGDTNLFYKNEISFGNYNKKNSRSADDQDTVRWDVFQQLNYPKKVLGLEVNPFVNWRETLYSKNQFGKEGIWRHVLGGGVDLSTRFYRTFDYSGKVLGIEADKVRHLLEPSVRYDSVRHDTVAADTLVQVDGIDAISVKDDVTFGLENRLQTKRTVEGSQARVDVVSWNAFLTYSFNNVGRGGSGWTTWTNEVELRPYHWLTVSHRTDFDVVIDRFTDSSLDTIFHTANFDLVLSHRYLRETAPGNGSSLVILDGTWWISKRWAVGGYLRHEFDTRVVEEWEIRATRDLHDWILDFGYNVRNSDIDSADKELFFELTLKAFPLIPLKSGNRATISRPRIGDTISGASLDFDIERFRRGLYRDERYKDLATTPTP